MGNEKKRGKRWKITNNVVREFLAEFLGKSIFEYDLYLEFW